LNPDNTVSVALSVTPSLWLVGLTFLLVLLTAFLTDRRPRAMPRSALLLVPHVLCGIAVVWIGFLIQPLLWNLFNYGFLATQVTTQDLLNVGSKIPAALLLLALSPAILPGTVTGLAAALYTSRVEKVISATLAAIASLIIADVIFFAWDSQRILISSTWAPTPQSWVTVPTSWNEILFSIVSNVLGGAIGGSLIGYASSLCPPLRTTTASPIPLPRRPVLLSLCVTALFFPFFLYFLLLYHLPAPVRLNVVDWTKFSFLFLGSGLPYSGSVLTPFSINAGLLVTGPFSSDVTLRYEPSPRTRKDGAMATTSVIVATLPTRLPADLRNNLHLADIDKVLHGATVHHKAVVPYGKIVLHGVGSFVAIRQERQKKGDLAYAQRFNLFLPWRHRIEMSREFRDMVTAFSERAQFYEDLLVPTSVPPVSTLAMRGLSGGELELVGGSRVAILIDFTPSSSSRPAGVSGGPQRITLPDGKTIAIDFGGSSSPGGTGRTASADGPAAVLLILGGINPDPQFGEWWWSCQRLEFSWFAAC